MAENFDRLLRQYATKTCAHSNTIKARAEKGAVKRYGRIEQRMAANLHTASLLLREAADRLLAAQGSVHLDADGDFRPTPPDPGHAEG